MNSKSNTKTDKKWFHFFIRDKYSYYMTLYVFDIIAIVLSLSIQFFIRYYSKITRIGFNLNIFVDIFLIMIFGLIVLFWLFLFSFAVDISHIYNSGGMFWFIW